MYVHKLEVWSTHFQTKMEKVLAKTFLMNVTPSVANFYLQVSKLCSKNCSYFLYLATLLTILGTAFLLKLLATERGNSIWKLEKISVLYTTTPKKRCVQKTQNNYFGYFVNFLSIFTCQSLVVMVVMVDRPTIHCLIPSPSAVVWVWTAEELNISPQVEMICFKIESSPEK